MYPTTSTTLRASDGSDGEAQTETTEANSEKGVAPGRPHLRSVPDTASSTATQGNRARPATARPPYVRDESRYQRQRELSERRHDPAAVAELVASVEPWIYKCAKTHVFRHGLTESDREDLVSEGKIGAIKALEKFDPAVGVLFLTYARHWIDNAMRLWLAQNGRIVSVPANMLTPKQQQAALARADAGTHVGANLIARLGRFSDFSVDAPLPHDRSGGTWLESIADPSPSSEDLLLEHDLDAVFQRALDQLDERERKVILGRMAGKTHGELAEDLRRVTGNRGPITRQRVQQLDALAMAKIRDAVASEK